MSDLVSVIIPVWNGRPFLEPLLSALAAQDYPSIEVIVVDNASTDGSAEVVAERFPTVRLIRNGQNLGFAGGCNTGLRVARGAILALLNQDTVPHHDWVTVMANALRLPERGIVGSKIFYPGEQLIQHAGGWFEWPLALAHHYGQGEPDSEEWNQSRAVEYVTGAAIAFRRELLVRVGLLDEGFWPGYFEDGDYCFRAREAGYEIWYEAQAVVTHHESTSVKDQMLLSQYYQRGRLRFLLKHFAPDRFLTEVVPAEEQFQPPAIFGLEGSALRLGYLQAMIEVAPLLSDRWQADAATIEKVCQALSRLHKSAWQTSRSQIDHTMERHLPHAAPHPAPEWLAAPAPVLTEKPFRSDVPRLGALITRARSLWYSVAARWGVQELRQQQQTINDLYFGQLLFQFHHSQQLQHDAARQAEAIEQISQQLSDLAAGQARIAQELARLRLEMQARAGEPERDELDDRAAGQGTRGASSIEVDPQ